MWTIGVVSAVLRESALFGRSLLEPLDVRRCLPEQLEAHALMQARAREVALVDEERSQLEVEPAEPPRIGGAPGHCDTALKRGFGVGVSALASRHDSNEAQRRQHVVDDATLDGELKCTVEGRPCLVQPTGSNGFTSQLEQVQQRVRVHGAAV
ncbi:MAG: hypothetical protein SFW67_10700 [Myxococcaceae bacterium]|nr:hypothetical protein [Myxococcaceae bacterium]